MHRSALLVVLGLSVALAACRNIAGYGQGSEVELGVRDANHDLGDGSALDVAKDDAPHDLLTVSDQVPPRDAPSVDTAPPPATILTCKVNSSNIVQTTTLTLVRCFGNRCVLASDNALFGLNLVSNSLGAAEPTGMNAEYIACALNGSYFFCAVKPKIAGNQYKLLTAGAEVDDAPTARVVTSQPLDVAVVGKSGYVVLQTGGQQRVDRIADLEQQTTLTSAGLVAARIPDLWVASSKLFALGQDSVWSVHQTTPPSTSWNTARSLSAKTWRRGWGQGSASLFVWQSAQSAGTFDGQTGSSTTIAIASGKVPRLFGPKRDELYIHAGSALLRYNAAQGRWVSPVLRDGGSSTKLSLKITDADATDTSLVALAMTTGNPSQRLLLVCPH